MTKKQTQQEITELQQIEQNLQTLILQKQQFQSQLLETDNALKELESAKEVFKITGPIMILSKKEDVKENLENKKETLTIRIKNLEKQEARIKEKASELQTNILEKLKKKDV